MISKNNTAVFSREQEGYNNHIVSYLLWAEKQKKEILAGGQTPTLG